MNALTVERRAKIHSALSDPARLSIIDTLTVGDASPTQLAGALDMPSNLLAHHLGVLREAGLIVSHRSQGDGRKQYVRLLDDSLDLSGPSAPAPRRVVFVCTANAARSHLAAALWRRESSIPVARAGTHPADQVHPGTLEVAVRRGLALPYATPVPLDAVLAEDDLVITVCDRAHEELDVPKRLHWSVPDPVLVGTPAAFDAAYEELEGRVRSLVSRLAS